MTSQLHSTQVEPMLNPSTENDYLRTWHVMPSQLHHGSVQRCTCMHTEHIYESPHLLRRSSQDGPAAVETLSTIENGVQLDSYYYEVDANALQEPNRTNNNNNTVVENNNKEQMT